MDHFLLPATVRIEQGTTPNTATLIVEPCYFGYGTTLGNALRRTLLSSMTGAAVTAVKIKGASHEFMSLDHVKEDVTEILLNIKLLRLTLHVPEARLSLRVKGKKTVNASDIEKNADVEIANPELIIATLTDDKADFQMELFVAQGRGYVPVENRDTKSLELGTIAVDSIYNPVRNIGYTVENVRVGDVTNFKRLMLTIETDGTIVPQEALKKATQILVDHFSIILKNIAEEVQG